MTLPDELYPIILSHIWDFALWRDARYVSHRWYEIIIETQPQLIWRFIRAGELPNGVHHGYTHNGLSNFVDYYNIFQYGKLIAQEASDIDGIIFRKNFDTTSLIYFQEYYGPYSYSYRLAFLSLEHKEIFGFCIDDILDIYAIHMKSIRLL